MGDCKLILFDMDGTLLNSEKKLLPSSLEAIRKAGEAGIDCAFGTGRSLAELQPYLHQLQSLRYGVCESGALVYDFQEKKILNRTCLDGELVEKLVEISRSQDMALQFFSDGECCMGEEEVRHFEDYADPNYKPTYQAVATKYADVRQGCLERKDRVEKFNMWHATPEGRKITRQLSEKLPVILADTEEALLEVSPAGVDKGTGLAHLAGLLGLELSQCAAVGDSDNDLPMLRVAGFSVAMGNANASVKNLSDLIVKDNDHEGILEAVEACLTH